ncbi:unnamed protein product [Hyaloperonospora brassicae]|uniref:Vta1/callose synthase N-terminal domain-containing protein n=1 Tax=Hyaloperonospora brassicae TaxID=162125 RepID=A0AAV0UWT5_HYABA|nr:unnamed protein product [Hyaloperonospora brassicae]
MADPQPVKVPPVFKPLLPFIRRAEELDRDTSRPESKLIAYYCRQYAMELGIKLREHDASNEATDYLLSLMDRLEGEKDKLPEFTQEEGQVICEDFALEIFAKADDEDRAGIANKSTARTFYAAGTFFDILNQFGDASDDVVEKRRYCKYKAAMILKAIKEGKTPAPGPPSETDMKNADEGNESMMSAATALSSVSQPPVSSTMPTSSPPRTQTSESTRPNSPPPQSSASTTPDSPPPQPLRSFPPIPSSAPYHSAPAPTLPALTSAHQIPPAPTSEYRPPAASATSAHQAPSTPNSAYRPPGAPATSAYQSLSTPSSTYKPSSTPAPSYEPRFTSPPQRPAAGARSTAVSQNEINDAVECAKFAIAALKVQDMKLAEERLEMALRSIRGS